MSVCDWRKCVYVYMCMLIYMCVSQWAEFGGQAEIASWEGVIYIITGFKDSF